MTTTALNFQFEKAGVSDPGYKAAALAEETGNANPKREDGSFLYKKGEKVTRT